MPDTTPPSSGIGPQGRRRGSYATLTEAERWLWHAEVYAFRRAVLEVPASERTSPCDPEGVWFDELLVAQAEHRCRARRNQAHERQRRAKADEMQREGRAVANEWARARGHADFDAYMLAERIDHSEACRRVALSILAGRRMPGGAASAFNPSDAARALGVTAREFNPSAEQMAAGRRALGLEPTPAAAAAATGE